MFNAYSHITDTHAGFAIRMENLFKRAWRIQFSFFELNRTEPIVQWEKKFSEKKNGVRFAQTFKNRKVRRKWIFSFNIQYYSGFQWIFIDLLHHCYYKSHRNGLILRLSVAYIFSDFSVRLTCKFLYFDSQFVSRSCFSVGGLHLDTSTFLSCWPKRAYVFKFACTHVRMYWLNF